MAHVQQGLERTRINGLYDLKLDDLACAICKSILWKAVICGNCETLFCSACIPKQSDEQSKQCLNGCMEFVEHKCPRFIEKQLSKLRIVCVNQLDGCQEIVAYDALEKHEMECNYQLEQCRDCNKTVPRKDLADHEQSCDMIKLVCSECNMIYKRHDAALLHTDYKCLTEQFRQLRKEFEATKQETGEKLQLLQKESLAREEKGDREIGQLRQEFEAYKQQTGEQIKQIIVVNYQLQENFETSNTKTDEQIRRLEQNLQGCEQGSDTKIQKLTNTLEKYEKADIRCNCGGRFCRTCGGCCDWKYDGKDWKRVGDGCRRSPSGSSDTNICRC